MAKVHFRFYKTKNEMVLSMHNCVEKIFTPRILVPATILGKSRMISHKNKHLAAQLRGSLCQFLHMLHVTGMSRSDKSSHRAMYCLEFFFRKSPRVIHTRSSGTTHAALTRRPEKNTGVQNKCRKNPRSNKITDKALGVPAHHHTVARP